MKRRVDPQREFGLAALHRYCHRFVLPHELPVPRVFDLQLPASLRARGQPNRRRRVKSLEQQSLPHRTRHATAGDETALLEDADRRGVGTIHRGDHAGPSETASLGQHDTSRLGCEAHPAVLARKGVQQLGPRTELGEHAEAAEPDSVTVSLDQP